MNYENIIEYLIKQDSKGLEMLYNSYGSKLYGYALKKWHLEEDDSWDIVYQTLYKLVEVLPRYKFESQNHFNKFILTVFINFLKEHYRKNKHQYEEILDPVDTEIERQQDDGYEDEETEEKIDDSSIWIEPEVLKEYKENDTYENPKLKTLKQALAKLDEVDREILLLKSQHFDYEEIAGMLKIDKKLLKVKYFRAKERLIKLFNSLNT